MRPTRACAGGEELQAANDTLAVDQVDSGEFGLRSIRQACGTDEVGEPGGVLERSGMGESSKGEHFDSVLGGSVLSPPSCSAWHANHDNRPFCLDAAGKIPELTSWIHVEISDVSATTCAI